MSSTKTYMTNRDTAVKLPLSDDDRWAAVERRDRRADGLFYYSVQTTGVYCRPSCASRTARRENVRFYSTSEVAERAGFRPCRRCRPKEAAIRDQRISVTDAIYGSGFKSSGRFYASTNDMLGMTPTEFRLGGRGAVIHFALGQCTLGAILVAATDRGVCAITLGDDPDALIRELQDRFRNAEQIGGDKGFEKLVAHVVGFVEAPQLGLDLPLDVLGTAFQKRVWQALRKIPPGSTASYKEIAETIGAPQAARAVAGACASNMIAVAIPCHRVVRNDGSHSGYRWGVERKLKLLEREEKHLP
jgi:AraC family transcriptional regulator, regulatory protein of adaptative response / methylated-DNA-[protein]-cysteine methyltransferase